MQTLLLYLATVLIWGTSWLAIKYQLGVVDPLVSIGHRMALAALLCAILTQLTQGFARLTFADHRPCSCSAVTMYLSTSQPRISPRGWWR